MPKPAVPVSLKPPKPGPGQAPNPGSNLQLPPTPFDQTMATPSPMQKAGVTHVYPNYAESKSVVLTLFHTDNDLPAEVLGPGSNHHQSSPQSRRPSPTFCASITGSNTSEDCKLDGFAGEDSTPPADDGLQAASSPAPFLQEDSPALDDTTALCFCAWTGPRQPQSWRGRCGNAVAAIGLPPACRFRRRITNRASTNLGTPKSKNGMRTWKFVSSKAASPFPRQPPKSPLRPVARCKSQVSAPGPSASPSAPSSSPFTAASDIGATGRSFTAPGKIGTPAPSTNTTA